MSRGRIFHLTGGLNVRSGLFRVPSRLSKKRRRETTVTETICARPAVLLNSRLAKGLSSKADVSIVGLLGRVYHRCGRALLIIARSRGITTVTSHVVCVGSKGIIAGRGMWLSSSY